MKDCQRMTGSRFESSVKRLRERGSGLESAV